VICIVAPGSTRIEGALNQLWICYTSNRPISTLNTKTSSSDDDKMLPECLAADPSAALVWWSRSSGELYRLIIRRATTQLTRVWPSALVT